MKILFVCSIFPPDIGGPATYASSLVGELEGIGCKINVISGKDARSFSKLLSRMRSSDLCYILSSSPAFFLPAFIAARVAGKKVVLRIGGDFLWERSFEAGKTKLSLKKFYKERRRSLRERAIFLVLKYLFNKADFLIFTSDFQKNLYMRNYSISNSRAAVIENPFPKCDKGPRGFPAEPLTVIYAGRLLKLKNIETTISVFHELKNRGVNNFLLKIVGSGPQEKTLKNLVEKLNLSDSVVFLKYLPRRKIIEELEGAWLAVLASYSEVSPNFILEACACATPVIITQETGLPEYITSKVLTFNPSDQGALLGHMTALLNKDAWAKYQDRVNSIDTGRLFTDAAKEHSIIFRGVL